MTVYVVFHGILYKYKYSLLLKTKVAQTLCMQKLQLIFQDPSLFVIRNYDVNDFLELMNYRYYVGARGHIYTHEPINMQLLSLETQY